MIPNWMFYIAAGLLLVTIVILWASRCRIDELEYDMSYLRDSNKKFFESQRDFDKAVIKTNEMIKDYQKRIQELEQRIADIEKSKVENEEQKCDIKEEHCDGCKKEENCGRCKKDEPDAIMSTGILNNEEVISYKWIFPSIERDIPIIYLRYKVVGVLRGNKNDDESQRICTEEAIWTGYQFITDTDQRFDKVYAYIRIPESTDIMTNIMEMSLQDKGD